MVTNKIQTGETMSDVVFKHNTYSYLQGMASVELLDADTADYSASSVANVMFEDEIGELTASTSTIRSIEFDLSDGELTLDFSDELLFGFIRHVAYSVSCDEEDVATCEVVVRRAKGTSVAVVPRIPANESIVVSVTMEVPQ